MKIIIIFSMLSAFLISSCHKSNISSASNEYKSCNLDYDDGFVIMKNRSGTLIYTDTLPVAKASAPTYYIIGYKDDSLYLPLHICNLPTSEFPKIQVGDSIEVTFSGKIQLSPETVDVSNLEMELYDIELRNQ